MQELDGWIEDEVIEKLCAIWNQSQDGDMTVTAESVKKAIREKVLQSYRNGQAAGPTMPRSSSGFKPRRQPARA